MQAPFLCASQHLQTAEHRSWTFARLIAQGAQRAGIRKILVASGIRMDLAQLAPEYLRELAAHHVGGRLKVAPEHTDPAVLEAMKKPSIDNFGTFASAFKKASTEAGKPKQSLVPYFIASHPGSDLNAMIDLAVFLKRNGYRPDQVQDFIPAPFDVATCMYYTGIDPFTKKTVHVARDLKDRLMQRALMQFFKPENYFEVRKALLTAGRADLIGMGCDCLIPAEPPPAALAARRRRAVESVRSDHVHTVPNGGSEGKAVPSARPHPQHQRHGYRPDRKQAQRRSRGRPDRPPS